MARSLNKVTLIGNLTRDPELRYTPQGTPVCTFGLATNRQWKTESGETKEEAEFHRVVAWSKLAEICAQMLQKGKRTFVEGRIQTRNWTGSDGQQRTTVEIIISDMILLDSRRETGSDFAVPDDLENLPQAEPEKVQVPEVAESSVDRKSEKKDSTEKIKKKSMKKETEEENDIPF